MCITKAQPSTTDDSILNENLTVCQTIKIVSYMYIVSSLSCISFFLVKQKYIQDYMGRNRIDLAILNCYNSGETFKYLRMGG